MHRLTSCLCVLPVSLQLLMDIIRTGHYNFSVDVQHDGSGELGMAGGAVAAATLQGALHVLAVAVRVCAVVCAVIGVIPCHAQPC